VRRRGPPQVRDDCADAGFAAADGLIAVTLAAMLLALVLNATSTGLKASRTGWDRRLAAADAEYRLMTAWPRLSRVGRVSGPGGAWHVSARPLLGADEGPSVCQVTAEAAVAGRARPVRIETVLFCDVRTPGS
jgi:hypothetical protein